MKTRTRQAAFLLLLAMTLSLLPLPARAQGDLSGAEVILTPDVFTYDGSAHRPSITVRVDGVTLTENMDFTAAFSDNVQAGSAAVTITGAGAYTGRASASFYIRPRTVTKNDLRFDYPMKGYDGTNGASVSADVLSLIGNDQVTAAGTGTFSDPNVGTGKTVILSGVRLSGPDRSNYDVSSIGTVTLTNGQITAVEPKIQTTAELAVGGGTLDLNTLVSGGDTQKAAFTLKDQPQEASLSASGVLTSGSVPETVRVTAVLEPWDRNGDGTPEYTDCRETITVRIVEKQTQDPVTTDPVTASGQQAALTFSGSASVTYGETLDLNVTGGSGTGAITYTVRPVSGDATVSSSGVLTPIKAGTVWVTAQKQGDATYKAGTPVSLEVTIRQARITIAVKNKTATVGDPVPGFSAADYIVSGLKAGEYLKTMPTLSYDPQPDMTRPGSVTIRASGAAVLDSGNYNRDITYTTGTLTIGEVPTYAITLVQTEHGTLTADRETAKEGEKVTLTVRAEEGYACQQVTVQPDRGRSLQASKQQEGVYAFLMSGSAVRVQAAFSQLVARLPFTDVKTSDWFYSSVDWVWRNGLMNGTSADRFTPNSPTSRGMIVTLLYRLAGSPEAPKWSPFADVSSGLYYAEPVAWAAWNGIVTGYSASSFGPGDPVTREQMAAIFYRYAQFRNLDLSTTGSLSGFSDAARVHTYARTAMAWANAVGLITGKGGGVLDPAGLATRAQSAAILQRFAQRFP